MTLSQSVRPAKFSQDARKQKILAAQLRLLYANVPIAVAITLIAALVLGRLQWSVIPHQTIIAWCGVMCLACAARFALRWRYTGTLAFALGAGLAGTGWSATAIWLYPEGQLLNQLYLVFILGGMMLGAASLLAPRPEAFFAFIAPVGLAPALRFLAQGDSAHTAMGWMAVLFTAATLLTTWRIHQVIASALNLQFENSDLVEELQTANSRADALNAHLEARVAERTSELQRSLEERQEVEAELLRARKLESLGLLAGGIAHDFNNFLTVVQGNIDLAGAKLTPQDPVQSILSQVRGACGRAAFLASQLLTFAKGGVPVRRLVSISQLITDAVQLARAGAPTSIDLSIAEDLRQAEVDAGQLGQALHNILLNARQAMPDGGIIEVCAENALIGTAPSEPRIRISVRDYGCGIASDVLPLIFDPYYTTKAGCNGLGLATAYSIVARHGGSLSVQSRPGHGSQFTIDLPASGRTAAPEVAPPSVAKAATGRLLVMDDEEALRRLLDSVLTDLGHHVTLARDGAEAIALCEDALASGNPFDIALLDLTVAGGMGGAEAATKLKEVDPELKLIVSSGYSDAPVMSNYREHGFDAVIPKPWAIGELQNVFRGLLANVRVE